MNGKYHLIFPSQIGNDLTGYGGDDTGIQGKGYVRRGVKVYFVG